MLFGRVIGAAAEAAKRRPTASASRVETKAAGTLLDFVITLGANKTQICSEKTEATSRLYVAAWKRQKESAGGVGAVVGHVDVQGLVAQGGGDFVGIILIVQFAIDVFALRGFHPPGQSAGGEGDDEGVATHLRFNGGCRESGLERGGGVEKVNTASCVCRDQGEA